MSPVESVEAQAEASVVTIEVSSMDPAAASVMPEGSTWTVTSDAGTITDTFAPEDLTLPATITVDDPVPYGNYTVSIDAGPTFEGYFNDTIVIEEPETFLQIGLTPAAQEPVTATVTGEVYACENLDTPGLLTEVGTDCVPTTGEFDFYLVGDESGIPNNTMTVDGTGTVDVAVGSYEVWANDATMFELDVPEAGAAFAFGFPVEAPQPEPASVSVTTYACDNVVGAPVVLGEIGPDCTPISADLSFYLWGDETDDSWQVTTSETGPVSIDLPTAGGYDVVNEGTQTTVGYEAPAGASEVAFGYPAFNTPEPETGTVTANVWHCLGLENPGMLTEVGEDCIPGPAAFDLYMVGDDTDEAIRITVGEDGTSSVVVPVGEYEVYEVSTDTRLDNVVVTGNTTSAFNFGIPRVEDPPAETGILSVSTYVCEDLEEGVVLGEIGDDCVPVSTDLSFYLWGDGTDTNWALTTSEAGPVDHELPVGSYEVVDEATQWTFSVTVPAEGASVAFGIPATAAAPEDPDDPDDGDAPVTELPSTGAGTGSSVNALGVIVGGAILAAGALGVRIRKS